jgi:hypothetical protein
MSFGTLLQGVLFDSLELSDTDEMDAKVKLMLNLMRLIFNFSLLNFINFRLRELITFESLECVIMSLE